MTKKVGFQCKAYRLSTGTREAWPATGDPDNLSEITAAKDVTLALEKDEIDASDRSSTWEQILTGLKKAPVDMTMVWDTGDTNFTAIQTAWLNGTSVAIAFLDGDSETAGSQGVWADWEILKFDRQEPLTGAVMVNVRMKPSAQSSVAPEWVTVAT